ncbi:claudin-10-like [Cheilinus undulatus]|uniref:claudin-10-like n=1 Tax=Cheilinus undulatus TaxID=241271 RepID=UPI001BD38115|nr:claudin-10-like [Cheilinus undulatus]
MGYRTVVMYMEIGCFVVCVSGWILVCSTMPTEIWTWSEVGSIVLTTSNYFSNLWKDCISDSTGVSDCKGIPSMLALHWEIHFCRALIIIAIILSFFGSILVLVGMKCTKIGGTEIVNARVTFAGGMNYLIGGMCAMIAFSYYGHKIVSEFKDPLYKEQKFEIGVGVFIGWGGSTLLVSGGLIYSIFAGWEGCKSSKPERYPAYQYPEAYTAVPTKKSIASSVSSGSSESRKSKTTSGSRASSISAITDATRTTATNAYV